MTTIRPRPYNQRRNKGTVGGNTVADPDVLTGSSARVPVRSRVNKVDRLTGHDRSLLPLTELQAAVLPALNDEPAWPKALAERAGLPAKRVRSALLSLSAKGLAVRTSTGWRKA